MFSFVTLNRPFQVVIVVVFVACCAILALKGKQMTKEQRIAVLIPLLVSLVFIGILLFGLFFAGGSAH